MSDRIQQYLEWERTLLADPDPLKRLRVLHDLAAERASEGRMMVLVAEALGDAEPEVRREAVRLLLRWERKGVLAIMTALRGTPSEDYERRVNFIRALGQFGSTASVAETLLHSFDQDERLAPEVQLALAHIRNDWAALWHSLAWWGVEVLLVVAAVAMPALGIVLLYSPEGQTIPWIPTLLGIAGAVGALLLARAAFDMLDPRQTDERDRRFRRMVTTMLLGIVGLLFGLFVGNLAVISKAATQQVMPGK